VYRAQWVRACVYTYMCVCMYMLIQGRSLTFGNSKLVYMLVCMLICVRSWLAVHCDQYSGYTHVLCECIFTCVHTYVRIYIHIHIQALRLAKRASANATTSEANSAFCENLFGGGEQVDEDDNKPAEEQRPHDQPLLRIFTSTLPR
jgi:hypothetical protein